MKLILGHSTCDKRKLDMQDMVASAFVKVYLSEFVDFCKISIITCSPFNELFL